MKDVCDDDCNTCRDKCYDLSVSMPVRYTKRGIVDEYGFEHKEVM
jgi:hypothetical protein